MATSAELEYLRRQNARARTDRAQGISPISQTGDTIDQSTNSISGSGGNFFTDFLGGMQAFGGALITGFAGAIEGVGDLVATAIGGFGDMTGLYDSKPFTDYAKKDVAGKIGEFTKYNYGFAALSNLFDQNAWEARGRDFQKIMSGIFGDDDLTDPLESAQYYGFKDDFSSEPEQFLMNAASSVGFMLPSILTGGLAGGSQLATLGAMGVSAAGKGAEEALGEGANSGQALTYGALSGGAEVLSELAVGPLLSKVGLGTGALGGAIGGKAGKTIIGTIGKTMFEEGMEEVSTAVLDPLLKSTYKGKEALGDYGSTDFWFGTDGHFNESVLGQGVSGAVVGGLMSGPREIAIRKQLGPKGYATLQQFLKMGETDADTMKELSKKGYKPGTAEYQQAVQKAGKAGADFATAMDAFLVDGTQSQKENLIRYLTEEGALANALKEADLSQEQATNEYLKSLSTQSFGERGLRRSAAMFADKTGRAVDIEVTDDVEGADYSKAKNTIRINPSLLETEGGQRFVHEYFGHKLGDLLSQGQRTAFYDKIADSPWAEKETSWKDKNGKTVKGTMADYIEDLYADELASQPNPQARQALLEDEIIANYLEDMFGGANSALQLDQIRQVFSGKGMVERFFDLVMGTSFKADAISKEYAKAIGKAVKAIAKVSPNNTAKALDKALRSKELPESEENLVKPFSNILEANKPAEARASKQAERGEQGLKNSIDKAIASSPDIRQSKNKTYSQKTLDQVVEGYQGTVDSLAEELSITKKESKDIQRAMKAEFADEARELKSYTPLAQKLVMAHINSKIHADGIVEIPTDAENISMNAEKVALVPFSQSGVIKDGKLQLKVFTPAIRKLVDAYTPENFSGLYNPGLAMQLSNMYMWDSSGVATPQQEKTALAVYKAIRQLGKQDLRQIEKSRIRQASEADYAFDSLGIYNPRGRLVRNFQKLVSYVSDPRASIDMYLSELSPVGERLINEGSKRAGFARAFEFEATQKIANIQKELGLNKAVSPVMIGGVKMPYLAALEWRLMLSFPEEAKEFKNAQRGYSFINEKTGKEIVVPYSEEVEADLEKAIPEEKFEKARKLIVDDFYGKFIYDKIAEVYKRATGLDYGELMPRGQYMRLATRQVRGSLLTPDVKGAPSMSNLMQRHKNSGEIKMNGGLFGKMAETARMTSYETYLQPLATEIDHVFNTLDVNGKTILSKLGIDKQKFVQWYLRELTGGIRPERTGAFGQAMTSMVLSNFKIGPIQTLSAFVSGLSPLEQFRPRLMKEAMKPSTKYQKALDNLFNYVPEAKYRGAKNDVYFGNVGDVKDTKFSQYMKTIGEFVSKVVGTNAFDRATVRYILLAAMNTQARAMKLSIDDPLVAEATEQRARQLYMTQISNNAKHFSPAQFVDNPYGDTTGAQATLFRMVKAFGGAAKAFTNFFNRSVMRISRMHEASKFVSQHSLNEYDNAIEADTKMAKQIEEDTLKTRQDYEGAKERRIELRDNRTKGPRKTEQWEKAMDRVHELEEQLDEASKDKERKAEAESLAKELAEAKEEAKKLTSGFLAKDQQAYEAAKAEELRLKRELKRLEAELRKAENKVEEDKGHKAFYEKTKASVDAWKKNKGAAKTITSLLAGLLLAGLGKTAIDEIYKLIIGRRDKDELKPETLIPETVLNSTVNLYPGLRTIAGIFQGNEASDPTIRTISLLSDTAQSVQKFAENQSEANRKEMLRNGIQVAGLIFGIPFKTMYDQITGIMGHFDPKAALQARNILYQVSSQSVSKFHEAVEEKDEKSAASYLRYVLTERVGETSEAEQKELLRLNMAGENIVPSAIPTSYADSQGEQVIIPWTKQNDARIAYAKANEQAAQAIASNAYKKMSDSAKANLIRSIYNAYRQASIAKAVSDYSGTMTKASLLASTGNRSVGSILTAVAYIRSLEATKTKTKKELAIAFVNSLPMSKSEKLLVLYMAGYGVDEKAVKNALRSKGMSESDIKKFQGENQGEK